MESEFLKKHVGRVLARGVAETVVTQPNNPQEYLALYLLHHLQEEERRAAETQRLRKAEQVREEWARKRALTEKAATATIQRGLRHFKCQLEKKKAQEKELLEVYENAVAEAEDLLEQVAAAWNGEGIADGEANDDTAAAAASHEEKVLRTRLTEEKEKLDEARAAFYMAQRFMLSVQKTHMGQLKTALLEAKDRVRIAKEGVEALKDVMQKEEEERAGADHPSTAEAALVANSGTGVSSLAAELAARIQRERPHTRISVPHVLYRVLRCLCYLLFNATPKATDTPVKVAALIKPTVVVQLLRAFNPVATYNMNQPLDLEKNLPKGENDDESEAAIQHEVDDGGFPIPQPMTRQNIRVQRVMRSCLRDAEYICELSLVDYIPEDILEEERLRADLAQANAAQERASRIEETVKSQTRDRGGVLLYALLCFVQTAANFRAARDAWVRTLQELSLPVPSTEELPMDDDPDMRAAVLQEDEAPLNDDGEIDYNEVARVQLIIGVDEDEALVRLWEMKDARRQGVLQEMAQAILKENEEEEVDEAEA